jgi:ribonuclease BN (tRNA processing enzyme)
MAHPVETYAMRLSFGGRSIAYSADTGPCESLVSLSAGADLLLCEASFLDGEVNPPDLHLTGGQAADHAERAGIGRLVLTHLVAWGNPARTLDEAQARYRGPVELAAPASTYDV